MKKLLLLVVVTAISLQSCKSDDDDQYPKTVNIKYEVSSTANIFGYIIEYINNDTVDLNGSVDQVNELYSHTVTQREINKGTYLKLEFERVSFDNSQQDANVTLKILVDNVVVKEQTFNNMQSESRKFIDYTFD